MSDYESLSDADRLRHIAMHGYGRPAPPIKVPEEAPPVDLSRLSLREFAAVVLQELTSERSKIVARIKMLDEEIEMKERDLADRIRFGGDQP